VHLASQARPTRSETQSELTAQRCQATRRTSLAELFAYVEAFPSTLIVGLTHFAPLLHTTFEPEITLTDKKDFYASWRPNVTTRAGEFVMGLGDKHEIIMTTTGYRQEAVSMQLSYQDDDGDLVTKTFRRASGRQWVDAGPHFNVFREFHKPHERRPRRRGLNNSSNRSSSSSSSSSSSNSSSDASSSDDDSMDERLPHDTLEELDPQISARFCKRWDDLLLKTPGFPELDITVHRGKEFVLPNAAVKMPRLERKNVVRGVRLAYIRWNLDRALRTF